MTQNLYKNELYKFCGKACFDQPYYTTEKGGTDHEPFYLSSVIIEGKSFLGKNCKTKKLSEASAALEALNYYKYTNNIVKNKACILINGEKLEMVDNEITLKILSCENLDVYVFINVGDDLINRKLPEKITKVTTTNTQANSRNICMMTYVGSLLMKEVYDTYFIATDVEFASVLVDIIKDEDLLWNSKKAYHITKIEQIYSV